VAGRAAGASIHGYLPIDPKEVQPMPADAAVSIHSFRSIFNAIPSPCFIVDDDVRILDANPAAVALLGGEKGPILRKRGGEALRCIHAGEIPEGCGHAAVCKDCVVRNSVDEALRGGKPFRKRMIAEIAGPDGTLQVHLLVTAAPFPHEGTTLVFLILEDIDEIVRLQRILPICAWCKKIRDDADYWMNVEEYFKTHQDIDFSHSICGECLDKKFPSKGRPSPGGTAGA
jgi:hypothetical protein